MTTQAFVRQEPFGRGTFVSFVDLNFSVALTSDERFFGPFYVKPVPEGTGGPVVPTTGQLWPR